MPANLSSRKRKINRRLLTKMILNILANTIQMMSFWDQTSQFQSLTVFLAKNQSVKHPTFLLSQMPKAKRCSQSLVLSVLRSRTLWKLLHLFSQIETSMLKMSLHKRLSTTSVCSQRMFRHTYRKFDLKKFSSQTLLINRLRRICLSWT